MKIRHFGLFFAVLAVILTSCHVPGAPGGYTFGYAELPDSPANDESSVVNQLARLQQSAMANGFYYINAKNDETIYSTQLISFSDRQNITVTIQSYGNVRRTLSTGVDGAMFQVQNYNVRLILKDIVLQGQIGNKNPMVIVNNNATLEMYEDSVIRGNSGHGVSVNGGVFNMKSNASVTTISTEAVSASNGGRVYMFGTAEIHHNSGGVFLSDSVLTMNGNAQIHHNQFSGGVFLTGAAAGLFMHGDSSIRLNRNTRPGGIAGGVTAQQNSQIFMYENAAILSNINFSLAGGGGVKLLSGASLNMHSDGVQISLNQAFNSDGGGVWMQDSVLNISGGSIHTNWGNWGTLNWILHMQGSGNAAWAGNYISGVFADDGIPRSSSNTDISVIGGVVTW